VRMDWRDRFMGLRASTAIAVIKSRIPKVLTEI
jgi:hypothetical protein